jgi:hypothetical protein
VKKKAVGRAKTKMKNIQVIDGALNCVYDIFQASDDDFDRLFGNERYIAFAEGFEGRDELLPVFERIWRAEFLRRRLKAYTERTLSASNTRRPAIRRGGTRRQSIQTARAFAEAQFGGHAAPLHSCKYRRLHAPATTFQAFWDRVVTDL